MFICVSGSQNNTATQEHSVLQVSYRDYYRNEYRDEFRLKGYLNKHFQQSGADRIGFRTAFLNNHYFITYRDSLEDTLTQRGFIYPDVRVLATQQIAYVDFLGKDHIEFHDLSELTPTRIYTHSRRQTRCNQFEDLALEKLLYLDRVPKAYSDSIIDG